MSSHSTCNIINCGNDKHVVALVVSHQYHTFIALVEFRVYQNYEKMIKICLMQLKSNDIIIVKQE